MLVQFLFTRWGVSENSLVRCARSSVFWYYSTREKNRTCTFPTEQSLYAKRFRQLIRNNAKCFERVKTNNAKGFERLNELCQTLPTYEEWARTNERCLNQSNTWNKTNVLGTKENLAQIFEILSLFSWGPVHIYKSAGKRILNSSNYGNLTSVITLREVGIAETTLSGELIKVAMSHWTQIN